MKTIKFLSFFSSLLNDKPSERWEHQKRKEKMHHTQTHQKKSENKLPLN